MAGLAGVTGDAAALPTTAWPAAELEPVACCPVCSSDQRRVLYSDLTDVVYRQAPGRWTIYRCDSCSAAYLDPRPTIRSIGLAYTHFYTHGDGPIPSADRGPMKRLKTALRNGYTNNRLKSDLRPSSPAGPWIVPLMPVKKREFDFALRDLPPVGSPSPRRLLDVGCGNGDFLQFAATLGWETWGVEADSVAAEHAKAHGIRVTVEPFESADLPRGYFDVITLCHVLEHFREPRAAIQKAAELLAPNGRLWIATPNLESAAHKRFQENWIGLDVPRHQVLFSRQSLSALLARVGLGAGAKFLPGRSALGDFRLSWQVTNGLLPFSDTTLPLPPSIRTAGLAADKSYAMDPSAEQELVVSTVKLGSATLSRSDGSG